MAEQPAVVQNMIKLLLFILLGLAEFSSGKNVQPFALTIRTAQSTVAMGSDIRVEVTLTNTSGRDIAFAKSVGDDAAEFNYVIDMHDAHGKPLAETEHHRRVKAEDSQPISHSNQIVTLKPGESLKENAILNNLYEISRPGKYLILAQRDVPQELGKGPGGPAFDYPTRLGR